MGTQLLAQGKSGCFEMLNVQEPEVIATLHEEYIAAGADIITTNTTCADALCLAQYGLQERSYELALAGAKIARSVADRFSTSERPRYVAGSVGPTTRNLTLANDTSPEAVAEAYEDVTFVPFLPLAHFFCTLTYYLVDNGYCIFVPVIN